MHRVLVFATANKGKLLEAQMLASPIGFSVVEPAALCTEQAATFGLQAPLREAVPVVEENQSTYEGNAREKAQQIFSWCKLPTFGDDSGLEVDFLRGAPGLFTSRYAGEGASSLENRTKLLRALDGQKERAAQFRCVLWYCDHNGLSFAVTATLKGEISLHERGKGGFGYDPIFVVAETGRTLAELKEQGVEVETHRVKALRELLGRLKEY